MPSPSPDAHRTPPHGDPLGGSLNISAFPTHPAETSSSSASQSQAGPICFSEPNVDLVNVTDWYSLAKKDHQGRTYDTEASFLAMQSGSLWGSEMATLGTCAKLLSPVALGFSIASIGSHTGLGSLCGVIGVAGGATAMFVSWLRESDISQRFNRCITREFEQALAGKNFLECIARTSILFNNIRSMNPITGIAPDQTLLRTDSEETRVSYLLRQIQAAGKYAYENRFTKKQREDGSTAIEIQLKDQKFDQALNDAKKGLELIQARWLRAPKFWKETSQVLGAASIFLSAPTVFHAGSNAAAAVLKIFGY